MPLHSKQPNSNELRIKTALLLLAVMLSAMELFFPRLPLIPWLKPGFANIVTILIIVRYGVRDALIFAFLRIWIVAFYFGFSFLTAVLALSGSIPAIIIMSIIYKLLGKRGIVGAVGISVIGAVLHNIGQLTAVYFLFAQNTLLFYQVPVMIPVALISGSINGFLAYLLFISINSMDNLKLKDNPILLNNITDKKESYIYTILLLFLSIILLFIDKFYLLIPIAVVIVLLVQIVLKGSLKAVYRPFSRFWLLFVAIAIANLFFTYGKTISFLPEILNKITYEGLNLTALQWLKIYIWLQLSNLYLHFNAHKTVMNWLLKLFPNQAEMLTAGVDAVEYFPEVVSLIRLNGVKYFRQLFIKPTLVINLMLTGIEEIIDE